MNLTIALFKYLAAIDYILLIDFNNGRSETPTYMFESIKTYIDHIKYFPGEHKKFVH